MAVVLFEEGVSVSAIWSEDVHHNTTAVDFVCKQDVNRYNSGYANLNLASKVAAKPN
jgi:hypothetical protein